VTARRILTVGLVLTALVFIAASQTQPPVSHPASEVVAGEFAEAEYSFPGAGWVGVGMSAPSSSPSYNERLGVSGGSLYVFDGWLGSIADSGVLMLESTAGGKDWRIGSAGTNWGSGAHAGKFFIFDPDATSGPRERFTIDADGNVGIGTDSPAKTLEVTGTVRVTADNHYGWDIAPNYIVMNHVNGNDYAWFGNIESSTVGVRTVDYDIGFQTQTNQPRLWIDGPTGNVGVGTTTPGDLLEVSDTAGNPNILITSMTTGYPRLKVQQFGGGYGYIQYNDAADAVEIGAGTSKIYLNGNVGVGTTSPEASLHVLSDQTRAVVIDNAGVSGVTQLRLRKSDETRYRADFQVNSGGLLINAFDDTGGAYLPVVIDASTLVLGRQGNVGVGTTSPKSALQLGSPGDATNSYLQLDSRATSPPAGECDAADEAGRMIYESGSKYLWICDGAGGWRRVATTT